MRQMVLLAPKIVTSKLFLLSLTKVFWFTEATDVFLIFKLPLMMQFTTLVLRWYNTTLSY